MNITAALFLFLSPAGASDTTEQVIAAEKAFAQSSRDKGQVYAFYHWLADDSILFDPEPVMGKPLYKDREKNGGELWWQPAFVVVAASGDMGMSTGPYVARSSKGDAYYGHFLTVWQKQADGSWRVAIDGGISHAAFLEKDWPTVVDIGPTSVSPGADVDLQARDIDYAKVASQKGGWAAAFADYAAEDVRLYRNGSRPVIGKKKALAAIASDGAASWRPQGGKTASTGDFGFTYGDGSFSEGGERFVYLRIWHAAEGNDFKLLVELVRPLK